jgi:hypothetical protein
MRQTEAAAEATITKVWRLLSLLSRSANPDTATALKTMSRDLVTVD